MYVDCIPSNGTYLVVRGIRKIMDSGPVLSGPGAAEVLLHLFCSDPDVLQGSYAVYMFKIVVLSICSSVRSGPSPSSVKNRQNSHNGHSPCSHHLRLTSAAHPSMSSMVVLLLVEVLVFLV
jgi:hypothetical protein